MPTFITVGPKLIAPQHVALVELYEASANVRIQTAKGYLSRVVLINRDSLLSEEAPAVFVHEHGFRMIAHDNVAINQRIVFQVEEFVPSDGYRPGKAYASRLIWKDLDGNENSKLLLSEPEVVISVVAGEHVGPPTKAAKSSVENEG